MTKSELMKKLKEEDIPEKYYSLKGGTPNDKHCIEKKPYGWEVYYSERGDKYRIEIFDSIDKAYENLYKRLKEMIDVM